MIPQRKIVSVTSKMVLQPHLPPPPTVSPPPPIVSISFTVAFIFVLQIGMEFFSQIFFSELNSRVDSIIKWLKPVNFLNNFGLQDHFNFTPPPPIVSTPPPTVSTQK